MPFGAKSGWSILALKGGDGAVSTPVSKIPKLQILYFPFSFPNQKKGASLWTLREDYGYFYYSQNIFEIGGLVI